MLTLLPRPPLSSLQTGVPKSKSGPAAARDARNKKRRRLKSAPRKAHFKRRCLDFALTDEPTIKTPNGTLYPQIVIRYLLKQVNLEEACETEFNEHMRVSSFKDRRSKSELKEVLRRYRIDGEPPPTHYISPVYLDALVMTCIYWERFSNTLSESLKGDSIKAQKCRIIYTAICMIIALKIQDDVSNERSPAKNTRQILQLTDKDLTNLELKVLSALDFSLSISRSAFRNMCMHIARCTNRQ